MRTSIRDRMHNARSSMRTVVLDGGEGQQLVGPSTLRVSLTFYGASEAYTLELIQNTTGVAGNGVVVPKESATPVLWTIEYHGDLVQQGVYAFSALDTTVTFIETILPEG